MKSLKIAVIGGGFFGSSIAIELKEKFHNFKIDLFEKIKNQVPAAIFPELNSKLACPALVTALASRLNTAVSIDNGIMHMLALSNIPMIVLFGPTNSKKFAPKNKFTHILDSKILHKSKNINSIEVDEVLSLI